MILRFLKCHFRLAAAASEYQVLIHLHENAITLSYLKRPSTIGTVRTLNYPVYNALPAEKRITANAGLGNLDKLQANRAAEMLLVFLV
jgi:hypothetical protein